MIIMRNSIYNAFLAFATERQNIFYKRIQNKKFPWTNDEILCKYKFTNAYRVCDRTTQYLIKNIIYNGNYGEEDIVFRILLFKFFNKIDTWRYIEDMLGKITYKNFTIEKYEKVLALAYHQQRKIFSGAYIMPSRCKTFNNNKKYQNYLQLLDYMMKNKIAIKVCSCKSLKQVYQTLLEFPMIGKFLAFQYAIDLNYSEIVDFSEMDFVVAGPGARSGIKKCFQNIGDFNPEQIIQYVTERQEREFERLHLNFHYLYGRRLQLIDCQNLFCEFDKYARMKFPDVEGLYHRTRIKRNYHINHIPIEYFYPPKWKL